MANEELIERARSMAENSEMLSPYAVSGVLVQLADALEAAEAKLAKTSAALTIERQGFNERMAAIEKANRILGAAIRDGIHPELAESRALAAEAKAKGPTMEAVEDALAQAYMSRSCVGSAWLSKNMAKGVTEGLFPQEQEPNG